ncbi:MAG: chloride channel protein [Terracidiphilus sp.]|nr:chloride channel protein [Terracidiphilus sp.]MDR3777210.1 chloride channel protein [Terracidiphilus sp.]
MTSSNSDERPGSGYWVGFPALYSRLLAWVMRRIPNERQRLLAVTILAGGLCGLAAVAFHLSIGWAEALMIDHANTAAGHSWIWWTILTPALGGLVAGLALYYIVPGAAGSGIPQVKASYALRSGLVPIKDAIGKFILCSVQIGSGASLGLEGPTVQICAGVSSLLARLARLSPQNTRRMASVGMAAGIAAAFNAPIAAVTFTLEELIGDLDQTMLSGVIVAAAMAAVVEHSILGVNPVFHVSRAYTLTNSSSLVWYALLGLLAAIVSVTFTDSLLWLRARFRRMTLLPKWAQPALGGLATGCLAVVALALFHLNGIAGDPYKTLTLALTGSMGTLPLLAMVAFCVLKLLATVCSYSSGGAGGIFAPSLFMGGMLGGAVGYLDVTVFHHPADAIGAFAVVGMGAVFAGIVRAPMTSVLIVFEMTGGYGLVLPLMIANMSAFALARYWRRTPIYEALLEQDGIRLPHGKRPRGPQDTEKAATDTLPADAEA